MRPRIRQVLFDFDGVLARYEHHLRLGSLAGHAGCDPGHVHEALFASGLETEYDSGLVDTATYLGRLGDALGCTIDEKAWLASRRACTAADADVLARVASLDAALRLGVLTNNGPLMERAIPGIIAPVSRRFEGRVLTSGSLAMRKPDPRTFLAALERLGWDTGGTLFLDDKFANVQGARRAGLHADTVSDARSLRRVLGRYGLA
ncbi:HAD-IA family hydrolase [Luteimonas sp. A534]